MRPNTNAPTALAGATATSVSATGPATDPRHEVLDRAACFLRTFDVGAMGPFEEWGLLEGLMGFARELFAMRVSADRIAARFTSDLALGSVGLSSTDAVSIVTSANGNLVGRVALAWANKQAADRKERTPEPEGAPGDAEAEDWQQPLGSQWPTLAEAALQGPLGELVRVMGPHTEADPVAILAQSLVMFGSVVGRGAYYLAEADRHFTNLFAVLVGETAKGRKGTALGRAHAIFRGLDVAWPQASGLSSGEGLIYAVRDGAQDEEGDGDPGVADKRLLVVESEYASVLRVLARDGNTLSAVIRLAWDTGTLRTLTKNSPTKATGAHVSVIGHITADELRRYLDRTEAGSGFANRHLWLCTRRARVLPFGGDPSGPALDQVSERLDAAVARARAKGECRVNFDPEAAELWAAEYGELSEGAPGLLGAVTSRAEAQTVRLALLYALADCESSIRRPHLEAALALWRYAGASARYVFGEALGDALADELLRLLRGAGAEGLDREAIRDALGRHSRSADIGRALGVLESAGLARRESRPTGGRPEERWSPARKARKARKGPTPALSGGDTAHTALTAQAEEMI